MEGAVGVARIGAVAADRGGRAVGVVHDIDRVSGEDFAGVGGISDVGLVVAQRSEAVLINGFFDEECGSFGGDGAVEEWIERVGVVNRVLSGRTHSGDAGVAQAFGDETLGVVDVDVVVVYLATAQAGHAAVPDIFKPLVVERGGEEGVFSVEFGGTQEMAFIVALNDLDDFGG